MFGFLLRPRLRLTGHIVESRRGKFRWVIEDDKGDTRAVASVDRWHASPTNAFTEFRELWGRRNIKLDRRIRFYRKGEEGP